jgi:hypothetical protein
MDEIKNNSVRELLFVGLLYLILILLMTYPIAFRHGEHYSIHNDYFQGLWNFWWFKESLFELARNPYFSDYLFHPTGVSLAFHTLSITNAVLALPFIFLLDVVSAFNFVYLITFLLAGMGSYLLVHDLTGNRQAAFLSGLVLAFCPYHFAKSYQIWAASIAWMPLFAFFFLRLLRRGGLREALLSGLMLFLASLSSWYFMVFIFLFIAFTLVYFLIVHPDRILSADFARGFSIMTGFFGLLILPFAYPMIREVIVGESHMYTSLYAQFVRGGQDLADGRTGSTFQVGMTQLFGFRGASPVFWPGIIGYLTLFLAVYGALKGELKEKGLWVGSAVLFFIFLLGPYLTVFDRIYENIPLPWMILDKLPVFKAIRYPHRFMAPLMMCLAVLAGSGAVAITGSIGRGKRTGGNRLQSVLISILSVFILVEYFVAPIESFSLRMSPFYNTLVGDNHDEYAILEVPVMGPFTTTYMYFQRVHKKKLLGGQIAHAENKVIDFLKTTPVIKDLANPVLIEDRAGEEFDLPENTAEVLKAIGIRYVLLHVDVLRPYREPNPVRGKMQRWRAGSLLPAFLNPQRDLLQEILYFSMRKRTAFFEMASLEKLQEILEHRLGLPVYQDDILVVYEVGPENETD